MKLSTPLSTLSALTSLLSLATANFDVYYMSARAKSNCQGVSGYMVFDGGKEPDCTDVTAAPFHPWLTTSGGNALEHPGGVRCQDQINGSGSGCESLVRSSWRKRELTELMTWTQDPIDIEMMEMFFSANPLYRWSKFTFSVSFRVMCRCRTTMIDCCPIEVDGC
jgi:hypothetical protein